MRPRNCAVWAVCNRVKGPEDPVNTGVFDNAKSCWYEVVNGLFYTNICTNIEGLGKGNLKPKSGKSSKRQHMNTSRGA